jgi:hypothetical protein
VEVADGGGVDEELRREVLTLVGSSSFLIV